MAGRPFSVVPRGRVQRVVAFGRGAPPARRLRRSREAPRPRSKRRRRSPAVPTFADEVGGRHAGLDAGTRLQALPEPSAGQGVQHVERNAGLAHDREDAACPSSRPRKPAHPWWPVPRPASSPPSSTAGPAARSAPCRYRESRSKNARMSASTIMRSAGDAKRFIAPAAGGRRVQVVQFGQVAAMPADQDVARVPAGVRQHAAGQQPDLGSARLTLRRLDPDEVLDRGVVAAAVPAARPVERPQLVLQDVAQASRGRLVGR